MVKLHSCVKIVLNLVFNDKDEILLIQEAKEHSRGLWFLPAGKGKEGESIIETGLRETKEEAGIDVEILSLLKIEHVISKVYVKVDATFVDIFRFIVVSKPANAEKPRDYETKDSIQAQWFSIEEVLNGKLQLRTYQVVELLEYYLKNKNELKEINKVYQNF